MRYITKYGPATLLSVLGLLWLFGIVAGDWLQPQVSVLGAVIVVIPVSILVGVVLNYDAVKGGDRVVLAVNIAIPILIAGPISAAWYSPTARAWTVHVGETAFFDVELLGALEDPDRNVRQTACRSALRREKIIDGLEDVLARRPGIAIECLEATEGVKLTGPVASGLLSLWREDILETPSEGDTHAACRKAKAISELPLHEKRRATELFSAALRAESRRVRRCTADLTAEQFGTCKELLSHLEKPTLREHGLAGRIVGAGLGEPDTTKRLGDVVQKLDLSCQTFRRVGIDLLCDLIPPGKASKRDRAYYNWLVKEHVACLDEDERKVGVPQWRMCKELRKAAPKGEKVDGAAVCGARKSTVEAVQRRQRRMKQRKRDDLADMSTNIRKADEGGGGAESLSEFRRRAERHGKAGVRCETIGDYAKLLRERKDQGDEPPKELPLEKKIEQLKTKAEAEPKHYAPDHVEDKEKRKEAGEERLERIEKRLKKLKKKKKKREKGELTQEQEERDKLEKCMEDPNAAACDEPLNTQEGPCKQAWGATSDGVSPNDPFDASDNTGDMGVDPR